MAQRPSHSAGGQDPARMGRREILVRVQACGLNDVDYALSTGAMSQLSAHGAPYICGMAATVIAAGDRVTRFAVGVLDPLAAAALAEGGLTAKTILRSGCTPPRGIPEHKEPEVALVTAGVELVVLGRGYDITDAQHDEVLSALPCVDFKQQIIRAFGAGLASSRRPRSATSRRTSWSARCPVTDAPPSARRFSLRPSLSNQHISRGCER
jgi:hypothetical protein